MTNSAGSGAGSLAQAILDSNNNPAAIGAVNTIAFSPGLTINLSASLPAVNNNVVIDGSGSTVNGGGSHQVFFVGGPAADMAAVVAAAAAASDGYKAGVDSYDAAVAATAGATASLVTATANALAADSAALTADLALIAAVAAAGPAELGPGASDIAVEAATLAAEDADQAAVIADADLILAGANLVIANQAQDAAAKSRDAAQNALTNAEQSLIAAKEAGPLNVMIKNLTITGGSSTGGTGAGGGLGAGGGVFVSDKANVTLRNVLFSGDSAVGGSGGAGASGGAWGCPVPVISYTGSVSGVTYTAGGCGTGFGYGGASGFNGNYGGGGGADGGVAGFGGGDGSPVGDASGGGGGAGLGGAIFVQQGGTLFIQATANGNGIDGTTAAAGGAGGTNASNGQGLGGAIFLTQGSAVNFNIGAGIDMGVASSIDGDGQDAGLVKNGAGRLTLSAANTYNGGTTINAGTLSVSNDANLGFTGNSDLDQDPGKITFGGSSTLQTTGNVTSARAITIAGASTVATIDTDGNNTTLSGIISGTGALTLADSAGTPGTLTLSGDNTYRGGTTINAGTLLISKDGNLGNASGGLAFGGGALQTTANVTSARTVKFNAGGGTIDTDGNTTTLSGKLTGAGGLTLADSAGSGTGTLVLGNAANDYAGGTAINAGTLSIDKAAELGSGGVSFGAANKTKILQTTKAMTLAAAFTLNGGATVDTYGQNATISGAIAGAGGLTLADSQSGTGKLTLTNAANSYGGPTTINAGTLSIDNANKLGASSGLVFGAGSLPKVLLTTGGVAWTQGVTLTGAGTIDTAGQTDTFSGAIGGAGALTTQGGGTLVLSGASNYLGGTSINGVTVSVSNDGNLGDSAGPLELNAGTLKTTGAVTSGRTTTLNGAGGTIDAFGNNSTFSGAIGGAGALTVADSGSGSGVVSLRGANNYNGGTNINHVTVNVLNDGNLGAAGTALEFDAGKLVTAGAVASTRGGTINAGGATFDTAGNNAGFSGAFGGAGGLTKLGAGTLTLGGSNVYAGGTTLNAGVLSISNDNNLGAASGNLTFGGGTLKTTAGVTSARNVTLNGAGGTMDTAGNTSTFSGLISGAGGLTVNDSLGTGTLILNAANTYTGPTTITSGVLQLGVSNALGPAALSHFAPAGFHPLAPPPSPPSMTVATHGTFDLNNNTQTVGAATNNGTINTRGGALTVNGNYSGSGTLAVTPATGVTNLTVTGTANIAAQTLSLVGNYANGSYAIVRAGTLAGTFSKLNLPSGFIYSPIYTPGTNGSLVLEIVNIPPSSATPTNGMTGSLAQLAANTPSPDLTNVVGQLSALGSGPLNTALNQISPVVLGALGGMSATNSAVHASSIGQRLGGLFASNGEAPAVAYSNLGGRTYPGTLVAEAILDNTIDAAPPAGGGGVSRSPNSWSFFVSGLASWGEQKTLSNAEVVQPGYSFTAAGATIGADRRFSDHFVGGLSVGYLNGSADIALDGGTIYDQSVRYGIYGMLFNESSHIDLYLGGTKDMYDLNRRISALGRDAISSPTGDEFNFELKYGVAAQTGEVTVSPYAGLAYDRLSMGRFEETGAGSLDLYVNQQSVDSLRAQFGLKLARTYGSGAGAFTPYVTGGVQHELISQSRPIEAHFIEGGDAFATHTVDVTRDSALLGGGFDFGLGRSVAFKAAYTADVRSDYLVHNLSGGFRMKF
ncbi:MAG: autotransporter domain-containing protein [Elusimicrobia bacterium]|nr:autotransporter domain-containing protein [Elusimicrobiota bacterium]